MTADPASPTRYVLEAIWNETLQRSVPVVASDNFFELGGDSMMLMMMLFRVTQLLGVDIPPEHVFENPTLGGLSERIDLLRQAGRAGDVPSEAGAI
jgi:acyl carrier protein